MSNQVIQVAGRHVAVLVIVQCSLLLGGLTVATAGQNAAAVVTACDEAARASSEVEFRRVHALRSSAPQAVSPEMITAAAENFIAQSEACYQELVGRSGQPIDDGGVWMIPPDADQFNTYGTKWGADSPFTGGQTVYGPGTKGGTVTYSFMPGGVDLSADAIATGTSVAITDLPTYDPCFLEEFTLAFQAWSASADIQFVQVTDSGEPFDTVGAEGDIRFAGHVFDGALGTLAHQYFPPPNGESAAGDGHFDVAENWSCNSGSGVIDIGIVAMHEIGHGIGLRHEPVSGNTAIMNPSYNSAVSELQADDVIGGTAIYGIAGSAAEWIDDPLLPGQSPLRAVHIQQLRQRIDTVRNAAGLGTYPWTGLENPAFEVVQVRDLSEAREAVNGVYTGLGVAFPLYTDDPLLETATVVRVVHIAELRAAVVALEALDPDSVDPTVTITAPTSGAAYSTSESSVSLAGTASDDTGVARVTWSSDRGNLGTATGSTNWSQSNIPLESGANVLTVTAWDAAGNTGTDILTVTRGSATVTGLTVTAAETTLTTNAQTTVTATATYSDDTSATVTPDWSSSDTVVVTVTSAGVVTAGAIAGTAQVTASFGGQSASVTLTVTLP